MLAVLHVKTCLNAWHCKGLTGGPVGCYRRGGKRRQLKGKGSRRKGRKGCSNWSSSFRAWNKRLLLLLLLLLVVALKLGISLGMSKSLIWTRLKLLGTGAALKMMMTMMTRIMLTRTVSQRYPLTPVYLYIDCFVRKHADVRTCDRWCFDRKTNDFAMDSKAHKKARLEEGH